MKTKNSIATQRTPLGLFLLKSIQKENKLENKDAITIQSNQRLIVIHKATKKKHSLN